MPVSSGARPNGAVNRAADGQCPPHDEVLRQLERILAHPLFCTSLRLSAFLRFVVESALAGRGEELKEYVIGVEVFERGASYSPQEEPVVRIMAGRLRSKLAEYYQDGGSSDPVLIELPRGGYVPRSSWRRQPEAAPTVAVTRKLPPVRGKSFGREEELSRLQAAFGSVSAGAGMMMTICGDAGMGKTTLVEDFLAGIETAAWVARGSCSERPAETDALVPIFESLDALARGASGDQAAQLMKTIAPTWCLAGELAEAGTPSRDRMRRELVSFLEELSRSRPVVLFLDDLHWAAASTSDLLEYLGAQIRNIRILILLAHRPGAPGRSGMCQELQLTPFSVNQIERYLVWQFPSTRFREEFARVVHEKSAGNPLFMTEVLRFLRDSRLLEQPASELHKLIPTGIDDMIRLNLEQLDQEHREILLCAAIQGMQFDSAVIAHALSFDPSHVEERLQEMEAAHDFVRIVSEGEFPDHTVSVRYRFAHALYQNVLYTSLAPSRRATQSLAIARAMVKFTLATSSAGAADLALLFESGRDCTAASQYFLDGARHAARVFAFPEAAILCERGLGVLASLPESRQRDEQELMFSLALGTSLTALKGYASPEVEKRHRRSRELCLKVNEPRRLLPVLWGLYSCHVIGGDLAAALGVALEMRQVAEASTDSNALAESLHALGTTLAFMGRSAEAREALEQAAAIYPSRVVDRGVTPLSTRKAPAPPKPARRWAIAVALAASLLLGTEVGARFWRATVPPPSRSLMLTRLTADSGLTTDPTLFAPGKLLAYASDRAGEGNLDIWVQQLGSGNPIRLTKDAADERWPAFSPDGTRIAFRTERNGGGIEVTPALGGESRRLIDAGQRPRFSPDGAWIAYWLGSPRRNPNSPATDRVFVIPANGGTPKQIQPGFQTARYPVWSPDGKYLLFAGWRDAKLPPDQSQDWWVAPLDGGVAVKTGAAGVLRRAGLSPFAIPGAWSGNQVIFSAKLGDSTSLWQVEIPPRTWQISGEPAPLTATSGLDAEPSVASDGSLVYTGLTENAAIWGLPLDPNRGKLTGMLRPLTTQSAAYDITPWLSPDGGRLVFLSNRTGNNDVWLKDLANAAETAVTATPSDEELPRISRDGSKVAYSANRTIYVVTIEADGRPGVPAKVCDGCGSPFDWSPDGKSLLIQILRQPAAVVAWLDLASGKHKEILSDPRYSVQQPIFSPDGRWISFNIVEPVLNKILVVPFRGATAIERRDWIAVTSDWRDKVARWSPDGNRLYFFSNRDGSDCIWMQPLHPVTKQPAGAPQPIYHLHSARRTVLAFPSFGFTLARDKAAFPLRELTGNIWMAKPEQHR